MAPTGRHVTKQGAVIARFLTRRKTVSCTQSKFVVTGDDGIVQLDSFAVRSCPR